MIRDWWTRWPAASIGIATEPSGLAVVDVDAKSGGEESLEDLITEHGPLDDTMHVLTGGGGSHFFYRASSVGVRSRSNALGRAYPGIDTRGIGGYVVAPPSVHISGRAYEWEQSSPKEALAVPEWLVELTRDSAREPFKSTSAEPLAILTGGRNQTLTKMAGSLRRHGASVAVIERALLDANASQCKPPLADAEIRRISTSVGGYAPAETRPASETVGTPLEIVDASELLAGKFESPRFVVEHLCPEASAVLFSGDTGAAKTAFALHMAVALAADMPVAGRFVGKPGAVIVYVNGEMGRDTIIRYLQEAAAGLGVKISAGRLLFEGADGVAAFRFGENRTAIEELVGRVKPNAVIFDTPAERYVVGWHQGASPYDRCGGVLVAKSALPSLG
jgi:hypothetical protein